MNLFNRMFPWFDKALTDKEFRSSKEYLKKASKTKIKGWIFAVGSTFIFSMYLQDMLCNRILWINSIHFSGIPLLLHFVPFAIATIFAFFAILCLCTVYLAPSPN